MECTPRLARWQDGKMARWPPPLVSWDSLPFRHAACLACSATPRYLTAYFAGHCTHPNLFNSPNPLLGGHHHSQHGTFFQCHVTARWRAPGLSLIGELHVLEERSTFLLTIVSLGAFEEAPFTFPLESWTYVTHLTCILFQRRGQEAHVRRMFMCLNV